MIYLNRWAKFFENKRETGMGYWIVSVILHDARRFDQVVIDSGYLTYIRGLNDIPFVQDDIAQIIITHDKWNFRAEKPLA